eukprot:Tamp_11162.p1 GENE.Tamp_11162~~Tamp_11162.p1  ORF type:complete len:486 (+),score=65.41 Tamp_11162:58-1458(+)
MGGVGGSGGTPRLEGIPLPEDLLMEVMLRLDWASVGRLARCCMRLKTLAVDDKLWQRLAHTGLGETCWRLTSSRNWHRTCKELHTLGYMCWERKPIPEGARRGEHTTRPGAKTWPQGRWGHTVTVLDKNSFMIFGGECAGATNDVHVYDCITSEWRLVRCEGQYPRERFGHACILYGQSILLFGGSDGQDYFNDLHQLDTRRWRFSCPETAGEPPSPRSSHSMTLLGHRAFVFGGVGSEAGSSTASSTLNTKFVVLDLHTWTWQTPDISGTEPEKRFVHRMVALDDRLLLFGGRTMRSENGKFNDLHWFHTATMTWEKVGRAVGDQPEERGGCTFLTLGRKVIAFCGRAQNDRCLMDGIYILHTNEEPMRWQQVRPQVRTSFGASGRIMQEPSPRGAHGFGYIDGKIVVFGGYGSPHAADANLDGVATPTYPTLPEQPLDDLFFLHLRTSYDEDDGKTAAFLPEPG